MNEPQLADRPGPHTPLPPPSLATAARPIASPLATPDRYRSPGRLGVGLQIAAGAVIAVSMLEVASVIRAFGLLDRLDRAPQFVTPEEVNGLDARLQVIDWIAFGLSLVALGFLIALTRRLYRNVPTYSNYPLRFTDGWAVGAWFVPFLNFVRPKQIVDDIWRAGAPDQPTWWPPTRTPVPTLLHVWWGSLIVAALLGRAGGGRSAATDLASARDVLERAVVGDVISIGFALLTMVVGMRLVARDRIRASSVFGLEPPRPRSPLPRVVGACAAGLTALVVGLVVFRPADATDQPASADARPAEEGSLRTEPTLRSESEGLLAMDLEIGDCFDFPTVGDQLQNPGDVVTFVGVTARPCDTPHDAEVFAIVEHPAGPDADYPNDKAMMATATNLCLRVFEQAIGQTYEDSALDIFFLWPADSWSVGDREIDCIAIPLGDGRLDQTVIGSGL